MIDPKFVITPITETEKETAILLLKDLTLKELIQLKQISFYGVENQAKRIRLKMETTTIYGALGRLFALGYISREELIYRCLPENWQQYIKK